MLRVRVNAADRTFQASARMCTGYFSTRVSMGSDWYTVPILPARDGNWCTKYGIISSGSLAIPVGSSGFYWFKGGTGECPTYATAGPEYWQPKVGNFRVN